MRKRSAIALSRHQLAAVNEEVAALGDRVSHAIIAGDPHSSDVLLRLLSHNGSRTIREVILGARGKRSIIPEKK